MAKLGTGPQPVNIDVGSSLAVVRGASAADVLPPVSFTRHSFVPGGRMGCDWKRDTAALADVNDDGTVTIPAGLAIRVAGSLESTGYEVTIRDHRQDQRELKINQRLRDEVADVEQPLLDALEHHRHGQVLIRSEAQRVRAIELVCRLYPNAHVLILVATKNEARRLSHKLRPGLRYDVQVGTGSTHYRSTNRVVATMASGQIYDDAWDIVIYAYAEQLTGTKAFDAALKTAGPRVYGLIKSNRPLPLRTQLIIEGVCGPVIHEVPDPRGREADVRVVTFQAPWMPAPGKLAALERKRRMCWHNDKRNMAIADVVEAFVAGDSESLWQHGLLLNDDVDPVIEDNAGPRVAIIVESPEHGRALLERLPGWQLLDGAAQHDDKGVVEALDRVIITVVRAARRLRKIDCDVLVWAAGGRSGVDMKGFPPRSKDGQRHDVLLVDVADDFDDMAVEEAGSRQQSYQDRGWRVDGLKNARRVTCDSRQLIKMPTPAREQTIVAHSQPDVPTGIIITPNNEEDACLT